MESSTSSAAFPSSVFAKGVIDTDLAGWFSSKNSPAGVECGRGESETLPACARPVFVSCCTDPFGTI